MEVVVSRVDNAGTPEFEFQADGLCFYEADLDVGRMSRKLRSAGIAEDEVHAYITAMHSQVAEIKASELTPAEPAPSDAAPSRSRRGNRGKDDDGDATDPPAVE